MRRVGKQARDESGKHLVNEDDEEIFAHACVRLRSSQWVLRVPIHSIVLKPSLRGGSDEAIHLSVMPRYGLLRGACHRAALRADPLARNDGCIKR
jgi:hypothetical protein